MVAWVELACFWWTSIRFTTAMMCMDARAAVFAVCGFMAL